MKDIHSKLNKIFSNNYKDWQLVLVWIVFFEMFASVFEYYLLDNSTKLIEHIPESFTKNFAIAILVSLFVWTCIYNIVFMKRTNLLVLSLFASIGAYLAITHDVTFNIIFYNLNPYLLFTHELGFNLFLQLFFKLIIAYLVYLLIVSLRSKK